MRGNTGGYAPQLRSALNSPTYQSWGNNDYRDRLPPSFRRLEEPFFTLAQSYKLQSPPRKTLCRDYSKEQWRRRDANLVVHDDGAATVQSGSGIMTR